MRTTTRRTLTFAAAAVVLAGGVAATVPAQAATYKGNGFTVKTHVPKCLPGYGDCSRTFTLRSGGRVNRFASGYGVPRANVPGAMAAYGGSGWWTTDNDTEHWYKPMRKKMVIAIGYGEYVFVIKRVR